MTEHKQLVQRKIRQLVFLHTQYVNSQYGKNLVDQNKEYQRIYADWQAGHITIEDIQTDITDYLKIQEKS